MTAAFLATAPAQLCVAEIPAPILACTAESDDARRLACFDRAVAQMGGAAEAGTAARAPAPAGAPPAPAPASAPAAAPAAVQAAPAATAVAAAPPAAAAPSPPSRSPEEEFGLREKRDEQRTQLTELNARAANISSKPHGELVITLDNGQVWEEIAPGSKIRVKPGDPVRIEAGTLRSFILIAPNGRSSKVARVR